MEENRQTYYITIASGEITQSVYDTPWDFKITATSKEIQELRSYFKQNYLTDWRSFWRSHIPFVEYHHDKENDEFDNIMLRAYRLIYQLGDQEAQRHIEDMGILK